MINRITPSTVSRVVDPEQSGSLPPVPGTDWGIIKVPSNWQDPTKKTTTVPNLTPPTSSGGLTANISGCDNWCAGCGLGIPLFPGAIGGTPSFCIECIRCYLARGLKLIGVDILLVLLLLFAIYILFQKQINVTVQNAARAAKTGAEVAAA